MGFEGPSRIGSKQFLGSFRTVLRKFQGDLSYFQECFKEALRKCYENFKDVSKKFHGVLKEF